MKVLVADGNRHLRASGYGALARAILLSLTRHSNIEVVVTPRQSNWDEGLANKEELLAIPEHRGLRGLDAVLRIGTPSGQKPFGLPTVVYTQNALGDLIRPWIEALADADAIIVPGNFDAIVFRRHFRKVFTCPQFVDPSIFKPVERYRQTGPDHLSFLFVGSYSYRKGVDLVFPAFADAFSGRGPVHLRLHCFSGLEGRGLDHLVESARRLPDNIGLSVFNGSVSPAWMNRFYNMHDVVFTLSRGEGWCMPLHEGLLCGKPVVAPNSTAMGEALPPSGVRRVAVREALISDIVDPFGEGMREQYGQPGNFCWDAIPEDAVDALRDMRENYREYQIQASAARNFIKSEYTLQSMAKKLKKALRYVCANTHKNKIADVKEKTMVPMNSASVFTDIHDNNTWKGVSRSGPGSSALVTAPIREGLLKTFSDLGIRTLIDAPCGTAEWIVSITNDLNVYLGFDIVEDLIINLRSKNDRLNHFFMAADVCEQILPKADAILCRDCLVHMPLDMACKAVANFIASGSTFFLATTFPSVQENIQARLGSWRPINMCKMPFGFPEPEILLRDRVPRPDDKYADKSIGIWRMATLPAIK